MKIDEIQQRIEKIGDLQKGLKTAKQMLKDALDNDSAYQQAAEEAKVGTSQKKQLMNDIYNQTENQKVIQEIKEAREEIATLKEILSEELIEYRQEHKTETITSKEGEALVFKFSVKLSSKYNAEKDKFGE